MPQHSSVRNPIEQKGKRVFIDSLERHKDLSDLVGRFEHLFRNPETREAVLYFWERFRTFPNILAPLASAISGIRRSGRKVRIVKNFQEILESNVFEPVPFDPAIHRNPCGKVWRYSNSQQAQALHNATIEYLSTNLVWEAGTLHSLEWSLHEILDNVFQHACTESGFFMFQVQQNQRRLSYCVADQGRGILNSFSNSVHRPFTAADAISLAVKKGVTRDTNVGMGNGLWGATEIVARNVGQLTISSSGAALFFDRIARTVKTVDRVSVLSNEFPGTLVDVQIDASKSVQLSELFGELEMPVNLRIESLENEDGAPVFAIRNFKFGTGTRESGSFAYAYARNILNETDQHLVIDFSGTGIVSSSFADEFIAKLFCSVTELEFNGRVRLHGMNSTNDIIIRNAISERRAKA